LGAKRNAVDAGTLPWMLSVTQRDYGNPSIRPQKRRGGSKNEIDACHEGRGQGEADKISVTGRAECPLYLGSWPSCCGWYRTSRGGTVFKLLAGEEGDGVQVTPYS